MASLIVSHDLRLMMLEIAVRNLYMPWNDIIDQALLKKTVIMFRMLDDEWTSLLPNRRDYRSYRGSSYENESFYGGKSVLFSVPTVTLKEKVKGIDVQFHVYKEVSKYFERSARQNYGFALVRVDDLLNGIIKDLHERKVLGYCMSSCLERQPIWRSSCGIYQLMDEDLKETSATIELYIRITYLGTSIITEINTPISIDTAFYTREDTDSKYRYQMRQVAVDDVETGLWGSSTVLPPKRAEDLVCRCKRAKADVLVVEAETARVEAMKESEERAAEAKDAARKAASAKAAAAVAAAAETAAAKAASARASAAAAAAAEAAASEAAAAEAAKTQAQAAKAAKSKAQRAKSAAKKAEKAQLAAVEAVAAEAAAEAAAAAAAGALVQAELEPQKVSSKEQFELDLARMQELIAQLRGLKRGGLGSFPIAARRGDVCPGYVMPCAPCYSPCDPSPMACAPPLGLLVQCPNTM